MVSNAVFHGVYPHARKIGARLGGSVPLQVVRNAKKMGGVIGAVILANEAGGPDRASNLLQDV